MIMSCESVDLKEYFLGEAQPEARRRMETHLASCPECRDELSRLQLTQAALGALRDEELPRRIAFVSDKVFEPRWYQRLWRSGPQLGFASAALLAAAILVHAFAPRPAVTVSSAAPAVDQAAIEREIDRRVHQAVTQAVADIEVRQQHKTAELLETAQRKYDLDRRSTLDAIDAQTALLRRMQNRDYALSNFGVTQ